MQSPSGASLPEPSHRHPQWKFKENAEKRSESQRKRALRPQQDEKEKLNQLIQRSAQDDELEDTFGFVRVNDSRERLGWLLNMQPVSVHLHTCMHASSSSSILFLFFAALCVCLIAVARSHADARRGQRKRHEEERSRSLLSGQRRLDVQDDCASLAVLLSRDRGARASFLFCARSTQCANAAHVQEPSDVHVPEVESYLRRKFEAAIAKIEAVPKEDLELVALEQRR